MGMITEKKFPMTAAGKVKLEEELEYLKMVKRKEVVERIKIARVLVTFRKTRSMILLKKIKHSLKVEFHLLKE